MTDRLPKSLPALWLALFLNFVIMSACASSGDVKKLAQENQVQDERIAALEKVAGASINDLLKELKILQDQVRKTQGRLHTLGGQMEKVQKDQAQLLAQAERSTAQAKSIERLASDQTKEQAKFMTSARQELDGVRLRITEVEKLIRTSLAKLPEKTQADKDFREAFVLLTGGQLDFAAESFVKFQKDYPEDSRIPEALYRQGQALYLGRKFELALVPFFQIVEKFATHNLAVEARWMLARGLEETGDLKLARDFYTQLVAQNTVYKADATRRLHFINKLYPEIAK